MRKFSAALCLILLAAGLGFSQSTAKLAEMRTSRAVDPKLQSPIDVSDTFSAEAKPVYITAKLLNAPQGTQVKIVVFYLDKGGPRQIAVQDYPDIYGTGYFSFRLNPPAAGWFIGKYKVIFHLNKKEYGIIGFTIVAGKSTPGHPEYKTFTSREQGFSIQVPAQWVEGEKGASSVVCMFLANAANDPIASLNVQVVPITGADDSKAKEAVDLVAQQLIDQLTKGSQGKIRKDTWVTAGGNSGRELDSEYVYNGKNVRQRQFLTYHASKVFILILTAEERVYATYSGQYLNAAKSLVFSGK